MLKDVNFSKIVFCKLNTKKACSIGVAQNNKNINQEQQMKKCVIKKVHRKMKQLKVKEHSSTKKIVFLVHHCVPNSVILENVPVYKLSVSVY